MSDSTNDQPIDDKDPANAKPAQPGDNAASEGKDEAEDIWAEALEEQQQQESAQAEETSGADASGAGAPAADASSKKDADDRIFKPLEGGGEHSTVRDMEMIMNIPVKLSVELGRTRITIKQLLELTKGSVVELDGLAGEPMDILINGYLIARGEVVVVEDKYGIRIAEIITPSERVQKLNR